MSHHHRREHNHVIVQLTKLLIKYHSLNLLDLVQYYVSIDIYISRVFNNMQLVRGRGAWWVG